MAALLNDPLRCFLAGLALVALAIAAWALADPVETGASAAALLRFVHVLAAMVWVGLIFFVNFIQLPALAKSDESSREAIAQRIVPSVAASFRHASHLTVLAGAVLLVQAGYFVQAWAFPTATYLPPPRIAMLILGVLGGLFMWVSVNLVIWPNLKIVLGHVSGDANAKARASETVKRYARLNLILALPVTFFMIAAAHCF